MVADALSRAPTTKVNAMTTTIHSDDSSSQFMIDIEENPINTFKNQLIIKEGDELYKLENPFSGYRRHVIIKPTFNEENLLEILQSHLDPEKTNGILTGERIMGKIQEIFPIHFKGYKAKFTHIQLRDIPKESEQEEIMLTEHLRAHRNYRENKQQILYHYFFPKLEQKIKRITKQCQICKLNKYERKPNKPIIEVTPIPEYPGQIVHLDIFIAEKNFVLTAICKFSKYAIGKIIKSRVAEDIKEPLRDILMQYGIPEIIVIDNEKALSAKSITFMIENQLNIKVYRTPPNHSTANGPVERFHSTLVEIMRCLHAEKIYDSFEILLKQSLIKYSYSIHSSTKQKPAITFFGKLIVNDPVKFEEARQKNIINIKNKQKQDLEFYNKNREPFKNYKAGEEVFVVINWRYGTKLTNRYKREIVKENRNTTILTESGRIVYKGLIRN